MDDFFKERQKKKNILDEAREKFLTIFKPRKQKRRNVIIDGEIVPRLKGKDNRFDMILTILAVVLIFGTAAFYLFALQPLVLEKYVTRSSNQTQLLQIDFNKQANVELQHAQLLISSVGKFNPDQNNCGTSETIKENTIQLIKTNTSLDRLAKTINLKSPAIENRYNQMYDHYTDLVASFNKITAGFGEVSDFKVYQNSWIESCQQINKSGGVLKDLKVICQNLSLQQKTWDKVQKSATWNALTDQIKGAANWCGQVTSYQENSASAKSLTVKKGSTVVTDPTTTSLTTDLGIYPQFSSWLLDFLPGYQSVMRFVPDYTPQYNSLKHLATDLEDETRSTIKFNENYIAEKEPLEKKLYLLDL